MSRLSARRLLRSAVVGSVATALAATAHLGGGGHLEPTAALSGSVVALFGTCWLLSSVQWTFRRLFSVLMVGQLGFHLAASAGVAHAMGPTPSGPNVDPTVMALAHFAAALVFALALARADKVFFVALQRISEVLGLSVAPVLASVSSTVRIWTHGPVLTSSVFGVGMAPLRGPPGERSFT